MTTISANWDSAIEGRPARFTEIRSSDPNRSAVVTSRPRKGAEKGVVGSLS